jgi:hypothetical protein
VALYWAPALRDPLHAAGAAWFGRDPETGATSPRPDVPGLEDAAAGPALYGLHASLRPPMRLATGWAEFCGAAEALARRMAPFDMPPLRLATIDGALALAEAAPCEQLRRLADACVEATDRHRLQPDEEELARRRAPGLSAAQEAMLVRWGYPYVMQSWRFHITLTRRLSPPETALLHPAAARNFGAGLRQSRRVEELCIFTQSAAGMPFLIAERVALSG